MRVVRPRIAISASALTTTLLATVGAAAALALPISASAANPKPSWRCIAGVCLGESRAKLAYEHSQLGLPDDKPSGRVKVSGGYVNFCFYHCLGSVYEDNVTYNGGKDRPSNRVLQVSTWFPIFALPDGVRLGTVIPFGNWWRGYKRTTLSEPLRVAWHKTVGHGRTRIGVWLAVDHGRVSEVVLELPGVDKHVCC